MNLVFRPAVLTDLVECLACMRDSFLYEASDHESLVTMWSELLQSGQASGDVAEDVNRSLGIRIMGFRIVVFLPDCVAAELKQGQTPYIGFHFLRKWQERDLRVLTPAEITAANTVGGLTMIHLHSGAHRAVAKSEQTRMIRDQVPEFDYYTTAGYQLKEHLMEQYGSFDHEWGRKLGFHDRSDYYTYYEASGALRPPEDHHPYLQGLTIEEARQDEGTAIARAFFCDRPRFQFKRAEQEMLRFALSGMTDERLAHLLDVAVVTVRKRWDSIYEQVAAARPGLIDDELTSPTSRGPEKKRRLLNYLRYHMEELRPHRQPGK